MESSDSIFTIYADVIIKISELASNYNHHLRNELKKTIETLEKYIRACVKNRLAKVRIGYGLLTLEDIERQSSGMERCCLLVDEWVSLEIDGKFCGSLTTSYKDTLKKLYENAFYQIIEPLKKIQFLNSNCIVM